MNIHGVNEVRRTEIHTAKPLMPEQSAYEVELVVEKVKSHKSPGTGQIVAELIKAGAIVIRYEIHTRIISIWDKEDLPEER